MEFKTHSMKYSQEGSFVKFMIIVNEDIYNEMVISSRACEFGNDIKSQNNRMMLQLLMMLGHEPNMEYMFKPIPIENERYLIYRFINSIFQDENPNLYMFASDEEYKSFCREFDMPYKEQSWFKNIYIKDSYDNACSYVLQQSLIFQEIYFPEKSDKFTPTHHDVGNLKLRYSFKSDFNEIYDIIVKNNIALYHFTDIRNVESIEKYGFVYSQREIKSRTIQPYYASSPDSRGMDLKHGLDGYVRLSFVKSHPMMHTAMTCGRISRPAILEINPLVLLLPGVLVSNKNALKNDASIGENADFLKQLRFDLFSQDYLSLDILSKSFYQAEVLVPNRIGNEYILNINKYNK